MSEALATKTREAQISPWQARAMAIPRDYDIAALGGRGPGKSFLFALLILRDLEEFRDDARILYLRRTLKALRDFEETLYRVLKDAYGDACSYNKQTRMFSLPYGYVELGQLIDERDLDAYQGRSFTSIFVDEVTQFPSLDLIDKLRPNLRSPADILLRFHVGGNPGGVGHNHCAKRWVSGRPKWRPFLEKASNREWVLVHGTYLDNPFLDHDRYRAELRAVAGGDPELAKAWETGDWNIDRGAFFAKVLARISHHAEC